MAAQIVHRKKQRNNNGHDQANSPEPVAQTFVPQNPAAPDLPVSATKTHPWIIITIALITFIVYLPALRNQFTNWDDRPYVLNDPMIKELNWQSIKEMFASKNLEHRYWMGNYHPLTILTLAINYHTVQKDGKPVPWIFILTNILLHVINTILVFLIILRLSKNEWIAFAVGLLFGIHTLHVESVAWIAERKDVLYTMFYLWSLLVYIKYVEKNKAWLYFWSLCLFVLSLLSKGQAVSLALSVLLIDIFYRRRLVSARVIIEKSVFFILALIFGLIAIEAQKHSSALQVNEVYALYKRIGIASYGFAMYLLKLFVPVHLSAIYPYPDILNKTIPFYYYLFALVDVFVLYLAYRWYKKGHQLAALGIAFFVLNIIFLLQLIPVGSAVYADRYSYIPSIGFFLTLAYFWEKLLISKKKLAYATLGIYSLFLIVLTISRISVWHDSLRLWKDTVHKTPKAVVAWNNLGSVLSRMAKDSVQDGKQKVAVNLYKQAIYDYGRGIKRKPDYASAFYNRGTAKFELGKLTLDTSLVKDAIKDLNTAIAIKVDFTEAFLERGIAYDFLGNSTEAYSNYKRILMLSPTNTKALINLGIYYGKKGELDTAIKYFNKAAKINPHLTEIYINRGLAYTLKHDYTQALKDLRHAIELAPNNPASYINLSLTHESIREFDKALADIDKAITLSPDNPDFYYKKALLLERIDQKQKACKNYHKAASLGYPPAIRAIKIKCKK